MKLNFSEIKCQGVTNKNLFGICDDPPPANNPAYIDEDNGSKWIAVVVNEYRYKVIFTAIDNCIEILSEGGKMAKRCDGALSHNLTITFVELKEREAIGNKWVTDAEEQLRTTINFFEKEDIARKFTKKKAYIANNKHPKFKGSQTRRMNQFFEETGYVLRVENRIILE